MQDPAGVVFAAIVLRGAAVRGGAARAVYMDPATGRLRPLASSSRRLAEWLVLRYPQAVRGAARGAWPPTPHLDAERPTRAAWATNHSGTELLPELPGLTLTVRTIAALLPHGAWAGLVPVSPFVLHDSDLR